MSGCLDEMHCPDFETIAERRNMISSITAGSLVRVTVRLDDLWSRNNNNKKKKTAR